MRRLSPEILERIRQFDSPTLFNAAAALEGSPNLDYTDHTIRCLLPELGVAVGYAVTLEVTTNDTDSPGLEWTEYYELLDRTGGPTIALFKDVDTVPGRGAAFGDGMASWHKALGVTAMVADGTLRDLPGIREVGMPAFAWGSVPGHGRFVATRIGAPVTIGGMRVRTGDLLVADVNGITNVPLHDIEALLDTAVEIQKREAANRAASMAPGFSIETIREVYRARAATAAAAETKGASD